ncbi:hypothetical protein FA13DRAFT_1730620 [Coprinellus micaceus]|uniref:NACHT domain-containing protein n=1 Tax=Coprinellus micaceus TaxID=71717 RepID=A0A4Y7TI13_COPMI|nr:hypothetical protein FA13DRAFT_1730620 [Coprinellus micaceus]
MPLPPGQSNYNSGLNYGLIYQTAISNFPSDQVVEQLYANVAAGAIHDSEDQARPPKCLVGTRQSVHEKIFSWMGSVDSKKILWLTGPVGAGKSAILGTLSAKFEETGQLAATFFFSASSRSVDRRSKRRFVTTLAYQLRRHPHLADQVSLPMLTIIQKDPAVFTKNLKAQMKDLILKPLQTLHQELAPTPPMILIIDAVDECQDDRIEVLSVLLQAVRDPAFPFRVVVASRPEPSIRQFFESDAVHFAESLFLEDYKADGDIARFLDVEFAAIRARCPYLPPVWPENKEVIMKKLVATASGQFIYAATVINFLNTPSRSPDDLLNIVLEPHDEERAFDQLDSLYISISKAVPQSILWLRALQVLQKHARVIPSAWTIDRLFESKRGQAHTFLRGLPSLIYLESGGRSCDSFMYGGEDLGGSDLTWNSCYAFYHQSFVDFLEDPVRYRVAFPNYDDGVVERWIWDRLSLVLRNEDQPELPIRSDLLPTFHRCFYDIWMGCMQRSKGHMLIDEAALALCHPPRWLEVSTHVNLALHKPGDFRRRLFAIVHNNCRFYRPCTAGCKRWRRAVSELPSGDRYGRGYLWDSHGSLLLDRFCIKRIRWKDHS